MHVQLGLSVRERTRAVARVEMSAACAGTKHRRPSSQPPVAFDNWPQPRARDPRAERLTAGLPRSASRLGVAGATQPRSRRDLPHTAASLTCSPDLIHNFGIYCDAIPLGNRFLAPLERPRSQVRFGVAAISSPPASRASRPSTRSDQSQRRPISGLAAAGRSATTWATGSRQVPDFGPPRLDKPGLGADGNHPD